MLFPNSTLDQEGVAVGSDVIVVFVEEGGRSREPLVVEPKVYMDGKSMPEVEGGGNREVLPWTLCFTVPPLNG